MENHSPQQWFKLEERFFADVDQQLIKNLREELSEQQTAESIRLVTGIVDNELAAAIAHLNVTPETLAAFRLTPLVAVAWADSRLEISEKAMIERLAEKSGITSGSPSMELLTKWLSERPSDELLETWCEYARALAQSLGEAHRRSLHEEVKRQVDDVAHAAGGLLKFGSVSPQEKATILKILAALS